MSIVLLAGALAATGTGGYFTSQAIVASAQDDVKTVTITVENGPPGPTGPAGLPGPKGEKGEKGEPGSSTCPEGFVPGKLVINHPGGQTTIFTCLEEG